jgi:hypothetical protein
MQYMHVAQAAYFTVKKVAYLSGAVFPSLFGYDCSVNIGYRPHVLWTGLFTKIYSIIWLSQNFLRYNSIAGTSEFRQRFAIKTRQITLPLLISYWAEDESYDHQKYFSRLQFCTTSSSEECCPPTWDKTQNKLIKIDVIHRIYLSRFTKCYCSITT